ncbi:polyketide synthase I [Methylocaldum marinum]|uniref:Polyketide synthase I n=1 Tax=Methylocaldum marinum TaxID=1432792 RepID=A0A250KZ32_9GAMM|nr:polyketide synthase I [Methylocaldum marinum]
MNHSRTTAALDKVWDRESVQARQLPESQRAEDAEVRGLPDPSEVKDRRARSHKPRARARPLNATAPPRPGKGEMKVKG